MLWKSWRTGRKHSALGGGITRFAGSWKRERADIIRFARILARIGNGSRAEPAMCASESRSGWQRLRRRQERRSAWLQRRQEVRPAAGVLGQRKLSGSWEIFQH